MSLKLVELQVALPRTQDAGKIQEQLQQRSQNAQHSLSSELTKEQELQRSQVTENNKTDKNSLNADEKEESRNEQSLYKERKKIEEEHEAQMAAHPYKGTFLDIEG